MLNLKNTKISFFDELQKYEYIESSNEYDPEEFADQLLKVIKLAKNEIENNGSHAAFNWYGWNLINGGCGFPVQVDEGIKLLEKAMGMGCDNALVHLADIHTGIVENASDDKYINSSKAIHYYKKAESKNNSYASYRLANCYFYGDGGTIKDVTKALEHAHNSIDKSDDPHGMYLMGIWLFEGIIIQENKEKSYNLFTDAIEKLEKDDNNSWLIPPLKYWAGYCLFYGEGIDENQDNGLLLINEAKELGNNDAAEWLKEYTNYKRYN